MGPPWLREAVLTQDRLYDLSLRNFYITWNYGSIRNLRKSSKYQILKNQGLTILNFPKNGPGPRGKSADADDAPNNSGIWPGPCPIAPRDQ